MNNNLKDVKIDLSKLKKAKGKAPTPSSKPVNTSGMISKCLEDVNLVGREIFSRNGGIEKRKP